MRHGASPSEACATAISLLRARLSPERRKTVKVGVVALSKAGAVGYAKHDDFTQQPSLS
jgi:hypothetical protein